MTYSAQMASRSNGSRGTALGCEPLWGQLSLVTWDEHSLSILPMHKGFQIFNELRFPIQVSKQVAGILHHR